MKLIISAAICILTLYLVDAYCCNGIYLHAVESLSSQLGVQG